MDQPRTISSQRLEPELATVHSGEEATRSLFGPFEQARTGVRKDAVLGVFGLIEGQSLAAALNQVDTIPCHASGRRKRWDEQERGLRAGPGGRTDSVVLLAKVPTQCAVAPQDDMSIRAARRGYGRRIGDERRGRRRCQRASVRDQVNAGRPASAAARIRALPTEQHADPASVCTPVGSSSSTTTGQVSPVGARPAATDHPTVIQVRVTRRAQGRQTMRIVQYTSDGATGCGVEVGRQVYPDRLCRHAVARRGRRARARGGRCGAPTPDPVGGRPHPRPAHKPRQDLRLRRQLREPRRRGARLRLPRRGALGLHQARRARSSGPASRS